MNLDFSFIDHRHLQDIAYAIRFVEGSTASIAPSDYPNRIRALDKYIPDYDVLNFTMPNGGTVSLNKTGSPTVVELEYWLDENGQWIIWQPDVDGNRSLTLNAGQKMYVRNTSETSTTFTTGFGKGYKFSFSDTTSAHGNINSLLCKEPNNAKLTSYCFMDLFYSCTFLITAPELPSVELKPNCYRFLLAHTSIKKAPILPARILANYCYYRMFDATPINEVHTYMTDISATECLNSWFSGVSPTGDFYCPAELTISTGSSGIPSNWTRHDLT